MPFGVSFLIINQWLTIKNVVVTIQELYRIRMFVFIFRKRNLQPMQDLSIQISLFMELLINILLPQKFIKPVKGFIVTNEQNSSDVAFYCWPSVNSLWIIVSNSLPTVIGFGNHGSISCNAGIAEFI